MAEGARLESVFTGNRNVGSNPTPSATSLRDWPSSNLAPVGNANWSGIPGPFRSCDDVAC